MIIYFKQIRVYLPNPCQILPQSENWRSPQQINWVKSSAALLFSRSSTVCIFKFRSSFSFHTDIYIWGMFMCIHLSLYDRRWMHLKRDDHMLRQRTAMILHWWRNENLFFKTWVIRSLARLWHGTGQPARRHCITWQTMQISHILCILIILPQPQKCNFLLFYFFYYL